MTSKHPIQDMPNPAEAIWALAAKETDPAERESLLRSAQKVDETHRRVLDTFAQVDEALDNSRAAIESLKKKDHVPTSAVILVFGFFFAFLAYVAVKHHL